MQLRTSRSRWSPGNLILLWRNVQSLRLQTLVGSLLIALTLLITVLMPWSEIALSGDGFMLGGHDVELTMLAFVLLIGIALLAASRNELPLILPLLGFTRLLLAAERPASMEGALASKAGFLPSLVPLRI